MWWRTVNGNSVWQEMEKMRQQLDRMADNIPYRSAPSFPALNVWSNTDGLLVTAEVPGVEPENLDIAIVNQTLTLSGSRNPVDLDEHARYHRQERGYGEFKRTIELPYRIAADKVEAKFKNGVLTIILPRVEEEKPRRIMVQAA